MQYKEGSALCESIRERTVMASETYKSKVFDVEKCRAKITGAGELVDCLAPEQAQLCGCSMSFGYGYFCKHPRRNEFIKITKKLQSRSSFLSDVSQSDIQE